MRRRVAVLIVFVLFGLLPSITSGQTSAAHPEHRGAVYVAALVTAPWTQGFDGNNRLVASPSGGLTVGWSALVGVFASPAASVEFDVMRTGAVSLTAPSYVSYGHEYERRDTFLSGGVRFHTSPHGRVDVEPVAAFGVVLEEQWDRTHLPHNRETPIRPVISAGVDLRIGRQRASFVASFRVRRTFSGELYLGEVKQWTVVPGAGLRVTF